MSFPLRFLLIGLLGAGCATAPRWLPEGEQTRTSHYTDGSKKTELTFRGGLREGPSVSWYADGTLRARGQYLADLREGPWEFYRDDGRPDLRHTGSYEGGRRVTNLP